MYKKMPFLLAILIISLASLGNYIPHSVTNFLFCASLTVKPIIIFLLPFIIFGLLYKAAVGLANDASRIIILVLFSIIISNFIATSLSQIIGIVIYNFDLSLTLPTRNDSLVGEPFFIMPSFIPNNYAMIVGVVSGILASKLSPRQAVYFSLLAEKAVNIMLKVITMLVPLLITGFIIKLQYEGVIGQILKNYTLIFAVIVISQILYITFLYLVGQNFHFNKALVAMKNMLPAGISGFSTMSSAASMPLVIICTQSNVKNKDLVKALVPASINVHLIGDCIAIPCFAYAILKSYGLAQPDFYQCFIFTIYFVMAKFSVAAIPAGGIIVMLPILEQYLGFNAEMLSLITALYILFDPITTSINILGNGSFALIFDRLVSKKRSIL